MTKQTTATMTYRPGVWLVDTHLDRLGCLMATEGGRAQLRPPGGGREWEARPGALRLATAVEKRAAGVR
ncbi:hypothetical protein [Streptomyces luteoverticillatus]|uniref:hypothetical protein n=1 Tax=Streptomyces luteoverticillatus TaxID=66425 RepID=UPI001F0C55CF|nr:hypothetical protein [Streptomyces luteoverticillatus]